MQLINLRNTIGKYLPLVQAPRVRVSTCTSSNLTLSFSPQANAASTSNGTRNSLIFRRCPELLLIIFRLSSFQRLKIRNCQQLTKCSGQLQKIPPAEQTRLACKLMQQAWAVFCSLIGGTHGTVPSLVTSVCSRLFASVLYMNVLLHCPP